MNRKTQLQRKAREEAGLAKANLPRRPDELGDSFPNDYLEVAILFVVGLGLFGSVVALYYLWEQAKI